VPHWAVVVDVTQVLPLQHPPGHEVALHSHLPLCESHSWPAAHAAQATPAVPQAVLVGVMHAPVEGSQQPAGHEVGSHVQVPASGSHVWPVAHATHALPPVPHSPAVGVTQVPVAPQQPFGQLEALQVGEPSGPPASEVATAPSPASSVLCSASLPGASTGAPPSADASPPPAVASPTPASSGYGWTSPLPTMPLHPTSAIIANQPSRAAIEKPRVIIAILRRPRGQPSPPPRAAPPSRPCPSSRRSSAM
jgi:hypothetical protein